MARRTRQISLKECYEILHLQKGADLQAVKTAYRRRAFELHPDLNPGNTEAGRQFQLLNEAYVALTAMLKPVEEARQRAEAQKAASKKEEEARGQPQEEKAQDKSGENAEGKTGKSEKSDTGDREASRANAAYAEQDVLRDLLNDPFARRVFEDIYSELGRKKDQQRQESSKSENVYYEKKETKVSPPKQEPRQAKTLPLTDKKSEKGVKGVVKDWLRKQIDEEQSLVLPPGGLVPGRKIRLQIRQGFSDEISTVEVTLPPDFAVGRPMRLRGLGKKVGPWQGDLYLTIHTP